MRTPNSNSISLLIHFLNPVVHTDCFGLPTPVQLPTSKSLGTIQDFFLVLLVLRRYPLEGYNQILSSKLSWINSFFLLCIMLSS